MVFRKVYLVMVFAFFLFSSQARIQDAKIDSAWNQRIKVMTIGDSDPKLSDDTLNDSQNERSSHFLNESGGFRDIDLLIKNESLFKKVLSIGDSYKRQFDNYPSLYIADRALDSYRMSSRLMNVAQLELNYKDDLNLSALRDSINNLSISILYSLYKTNNSKKYIKSVLVCSEESMNGMQREQVNRSKWRSNSQVPIELTILEQRLQERLDFSRKLIGQGEKKYETGSEMIEIFEDLMARTQFDIDSIKTILFNDHRSYFDIVYGQKEVTLEEVQDSISFDDMVLQYVYATEGIYLVTITKTDAGFYRIPVDRELINDLNQYSHQLQDYRETSPEQLCAIGNRLFNKLLGAAGTLKKNLIIVPDGRLATLPFETLIDLAGTECGKSYRDLPYLLKDTDIRYVNSLGQLLQEQSAETKDFNYDLIAMAPIYNEALEESATIEDSVRAGTGNLVHTREEVNSISGYYKSRTYLDGEATETSFKKSLSDSRVIHIASHALIDRDDPLFSRIVFDIDPLDTLNDGNLYVHEIYNLAVGAELVVLSACNTGSGEIKEGEGIMSLGRGFFYAGAKSVVLSHWQVADRSTSVLMKYFYENLSNGNSKSEALREAKLQFLSEVSDTEQHPFFWAAFISIGDDSPIDSNSNKNQFLLLFAFVSITVIASLSVRKRRRR